MFIKSTSCQRRRPCWFVYVDSWGHMMSVCSTAKHPRLDTSKIHSNLLWRFNLKKHTFAKISIELNLVKSKVNLHLLLIEFPCYLPSKSCIAKKNVFDFSSQSKKCLALENLTFLLNLPNFYYFFCDKFRILERNLRKSYRKRKLKIIDK